MPTAKESMQTFEPTLRARVKQAFQRALGQFAADADVMLKDISQIGGVCYLVDWGTGRVISLCISKNAIMDYLVREHSTEKASGRLSEWVAEQLRSNPVDSWTLKNDDIR